MSTAYEAYVSVHARTTEMATRFLDYFLPRRTQAADEYEYPQFSASPEQIFRTAEETMAALAIDRSRSYALYWNRIGDGDPKQGMLFYTEDDGLIAGLASANPDPVALLREMAAVTGGRFGYTTADERPPESMRDFRLRSRVAQTPRLVDGTVIVGDTSILLNP